MSREPEKRMLPPTLHRHRRLGAWFRFEDDGESLTVFSGKVELGQGIKTALAQIASEELDVDFARITVVGADTEATPNEGATTGSMSLELSGNAIRQASADLRMNMKKSAAITLEVPEDELVISNGIISAQGTNKTTSYWQISGSRDDLWEADGEGPVKSADSYSVVGQSIERSDLPAKVTGAEAFLHDLRLPDMVHARMLRGPSYRARLASLDRDAIAAELIEDGGVIGIICETEAAAVAALETAIANARWHEVATLPDHETLHAWLLENVESAALVVDGTPNADPVPDVIRSENTIDATYTRPYHQHASIGPSVAVAQFKDAKLTVWSHSQGIYILRDVLAERLKLEPENVHCIHREGAGCYGQNGADDVAYEAARLAIARPGAPIRLQWTRDDEHAFEPYGPAMVMQMAGALGEDGKILSWNHDVTSNAHTGRPRPGLEGSAFVSDWQRDPQINAPLAQPTGGRHVGAHRNADHLYDVGERRIVTHFVGKQPIRVSSMRGLGAYANVFAIESFMDELANEAGTDPVAFRLSHLTDKRAIAVIEAAADRAHWGSARGENEGRGIAFAQYKNLQCYACMIVELAVDPATGVIDLQRAVISGDAGQVVNPDGLANQLEGGFIQAASWTLKEEVTFDNVRITSRDWETYPILRMDEAPEIETIILNQPGEPYMGAGEGTQGPAPAAIANAVFDAIGVRLREIPFTPDRVRRSLGSP